MKGYSAVIDQLNKVLLAELTSINHFFLHARMFKNWGLENLNAKSYNKSIKDMKQADAVIERILFLEGLPNLQALEPLNIGEHTEEMLSLDKDMQTAEVAVLKDAIRVCEEKADFVSRDVLESILKVEEDYIDWLETQEYMIQHSGLENYLQLQMVSETD